MISSHFMQKLQSEGYQGVHRWYRKEDLTDKDLIIVYINHGGCHWTLLVCVYIYQLICSYMYLHIYPLVPATFKQGYGHENSRSRVL